TNYPLALSVDDLGAGFMLTAQAQSPIDPMRVCGFMNTALERLVEALEQAPGTTVCSLDVLPAGERRQLLEEWNATGSEYPREKLIHELFEAQAEAHPDAVALVAEGMRLTYSELNARANRLANYLRGHGVAAQARVAICVERSIEMVVAVLATLKAGGAYVPLDPAYPPERLAYMLDDCDPVVLLTHDPAKTVLDRLSTQVPILNLDHDASLWNSRSQRNTRRIDTGLDSRHLAYIIYTSGSTGRPKGVMVSHRAICNHVRWKVETYPLMTEDKVLQKTPFSFDVSVSEFFWPLVSGATLVIAQPEGHKDPDYLVEVINEQCVTDIIFVPSMLHIFIESAGPERCPGLRRVMCIGEALPAELLHRFYSSSSASLINLYGPTEAAVEVTHWPCLPEYNESILPIGRPTANTQIYLLDASLQPVPVGVPGELFIGGENLARGYLNRPSLTTEKFIPSPFGATPGARLYRSGDLARFRPDGQIEYLGRSDFQVKVRGFRIEMGEIEAVLNEHPGVSQSIVTVHEEMNGDRRLIAYLIPAGEAIGGGAELRHFLEERLPDYMVPSSFTTLTTWPLTQSGKVDRKALPAPDISSSDNESEKVAPRSPLEAGVAAIWGEVLGLRQVGIYDNFFNLGGHSLLATQIVSRLRQTFSLELPLRAVFENPTVHQLARRLADAMTADSPAAGPPLRPVPRAGDLPLSFAQQRLWFLDQLEPGNPFYNVSGAALMRGRLDVGALRASINSVVARHEALRTRFVATDGEPAQIIEPEVEIELAETDLRGIEGERREAELKRLARAEAVAPFDLSRAPLLRARLVRLAEQEQALLAVMHHIVSDGWSLGVFVKELAEFYGAAARGGRADLPELPVQYGDYAVWQREMMAGERSEEQLRYWRERLKDAGELLELPTDRPRPPVQSFRGASEIVQLPADLHKSLMELSRQEEATIFMTLLAGFRALLYRYTGQRRISVGTPIAGRTHQELEGLIGFFVNTLVLSTDVQGDQSFRELLRQVKEVATDAYAHQDTPFERLVEELAPERSLSYAPLFQVLFALQNAPRHELAVEGLTTEMTAIENSTAKYDLSFSLEETEDGLTGKLTYSTDLFEASTIKRLLAHFVNFLEGALARPDAPLAQIEFLTAAERRNLLTEWNETAESLGTERCLHHLFEDQAATQPSSLAVVYEEQCLSFAELDRRANQLAHHLQALGVGTEDRVGIYLERSPEMIVSLLAVLKAGGAYVPLDTLYPSERLAYMLADAQAKVLLTETNLLAGVPECGAAIVCLDRDGAAIRDRSDVRPARNTGPANLAYVLYTSGSTGRPKGVAVEHRQIVHYTRSISRRLKLTGDMTFAVVSTLAADLGYTMVCPALANGGRLHVISAERAADAESLADYCERRRIDCLKIVPSHLGALLNSPRAASLLPHQLLALGGEASAWELIGKVSELRPECRIFNHYGPTETTVGVITGQLRRDSGETESVLPPLGRPIHNVQLYVLDAALQPAPMGVAGELYIGGAAVSRGYLNAPALTAEKFVPDQFGAEPGQRLYRTGDLARYRPDGRLEFVGRADHQVKVRGFRIELGEIEAAIEREPSILQAVVIIREETPGDRRLAAYVVPKAGQRADLTQLRQRLRSALPEYMMPAAFVAIDALPLTPNGKVDRAALPAPNKPQEDLNKAMVAPRTPIETDVAAVWKEVLGLAQIGAHDNFFDLGGHSLLVTQVVSRLRKVFHVELPIRALFEGPTVAETAARIEAALTASDLRATAPIVRGERGPGAPQPLSFAQQRLWLLAQLEPDNPFYNVPCAVRMTGRLNIAALRQSVNKIIARHEILRTVFRQVGSQLAQVVLPELNLDIPVTDLAGRLEAEREKEVERLAREEAARTFDLEQGPLMRVKLLALQPEEHVLLATMHHIISDAWSGSVFVREIAMLYEAYNSEQEALLPELPVQYADYAVWQRERLSGDVLDKLTGYWKERLDDACHTLELPADYVRPARLSYQGADREFRLTQDSASELKSLSNKEGVTFFMTLLAAFYTLLYRYTRQKDISIGAPIAGRNQAELEALIGFFINMLVLRVDLSGDPTFRELLRRVKEVCLGAYTHQEMPFEKLVEELQPERDLSRNPLVQVVFAMQNAPRGELALSGLNLREWDAGQETRFDLELHFREQAEESQVIFTYSTDLFADATIERMIGRYQLLLESIVANPDQKLSELRLLSEREESLVLTEWNAISRDYPDDKLIHELFAAQVTRAPAAVALIDGARQVTYAELNRRANQLARRLQRLGLKTESRVGLLLDRSIELIISVLGVLKAGGAYVPLDPSYPAERLEFMLADTGSRLCLTESSSLDKLSAVGAQTICLDTDWADIAQEPETEPQTSATPDHLAYVMYTSGSTGIPKGVAIPHKAVNRLVHNTNYVQFSDKENFAHISNVSFDAATFEIWGALLHGGRLTILDKEIVLSPPELARQIGAQGISAMFITAALFNQIAHVAPQTFCAARYVLVGGEAAEPQSFRRVLLNSPPENLCNAYGPTENTTFSAWHPVTEAPENATSIPIGGPIANTQLFVLDENFRPAPIGVDGELLLGGDGLARAYYNRPGLTAEKFVPHPFSRREGERLYCTGDLARWLPSGAVEFIGRLDHQVKVRGFRVETGEIEAVLRKHPRVKDCAVIARADGSGSKRLIAHIVTVPSDLADLADLALASPVNGSAPSPAQPAQGQTSAEQAELARLLRTYLQTRMPEYMIPSAFVVHDEMPLNANRKVDRQALAAMEPHFAASQEGFVAPRTPSEEMLAGIWSAVLNAPRVSMTDSFFDLGGHSLMATQVISRVREIFKVELPLRAIFEAQTIADLAARVDEALGGGPEIKSMPIGRVTRTGNLPLSFAQQRLWFLDRLRPGSVAYNIPGVVRVTGRLDVQALERTLSEIYRRHESLRTNFVIADGEATQVIHPGGDFALEHLDFSALGEGLREAAAQAAIRERVAQPFDLTKDRLFRCALLKISDEERVLMILMHHIISDGWSMQVLMREMAALCAAYAEGRQSPLDESPIQYADFASWQRDWLSGDRLNRQLTYWRQQLAGAPATLNLLTDRPRPAVQTSESEKRKFTLPAGLRDRLAAFSRDEGVTLFMTLLAGFKAILYRYSGQEDVVIGTPIANRNRIEIENLIGFFVNMLVLRTDLGRAPSFRELVRRVKETSLNAYGRQDLPFEKLVEELQPERDLSHTPFFQVTFVLQNSLREKLNLPDVRFEVLDYDIGQAKFDLMLAMSDTEQGLAGLLEYNRHLFDPATIDRFIRHYVNLLEDAVADPDGRIGALLLLTPAEDRMMLVEWNDTRAPFPDEFCLHQLFELHAARLPEAIAVVLGDCQMSYGSLNARANQLAHYLRAQGIGPEEVVGLCVERSVETLIGLLGIMKAGGAYLPLDPTYPPERLSY
ncbi:MAG TPA: amino acid adenylation domain-containing protein, partial [Blastocatellia bacterium]|nr:amino acid adenylation domain-containing protein [Blastocatellia bacterium]